jgi:hypothetical protein
MNRRLKQTVSIFILQEGGGIIFGISYPLSSSMNYLTEEGGIAADAVGFK